MKAKFIYESLENILKPKEGALEQLHNELNYQNLMAPPLYSDGMDDWLKENPALANALEYKGLEDADNIVGFDLDSTMEEYPFEKEDFLNYVFPMEEISRVFIPSDSNSNGIGGQLRMQEIIFDNNTKVIYYDGGLVDGYIARKEWIF